MAAALRVPSVARIAVPGLIVIIAVAGYVGAGAWNQSGEPWLAITLTEGELPLAILPNTAPGDEPGLRVRFALEYRTDPLDARNWLSDSRLQEIGFPLQMPAGASEAADAYDNVPPRIAWVALEHDGAAYREIERRRALLAAEDPARHLAAPRSRLVPVDAAVDFDTLHTRYPTGHLIVRAIIALTYLAPEQGGPLVYGRLRELVPATISVPKSLRDVFEGLPTRVETADPEPRYEIELAIGRLGLPYVRAARRLR